MYHPITKVIYELHLKYAEEADKKGDIKDATIQRQLAELSKNNNIKGYNQYCKENNINAKFNLL